jgi:hypothetical protein
MHDSVTINMMIVPNPPNKFQQSARSSYGTGASGPFNAFKKDTIRKDQKQFRILSATSNLMIRFVGRTAGRRIGSSKHGHHRFYMDARRRSLRNVGRTVAVRAIGAQAAPTLLDLLRTSMPDQSQALFGGEGDDDDGT